MKLLCALLLLAVAVNAGPSVVPVQKALLPEEGTVKINPRIIDGDEASPNTAPYLVSLSLSDIAYAHSCAGSIIGKEWVLTAAHCITELQSFSGSAVGLPVYAGLHDRSQLEEAQIRTIDFAFAHKEFTGEQGSDDIALLHVSQPFSLNSKVKSAVLPAKDEEFEGEQSAIYGWGLTDNDATTYVKDLRVAKAPVLNSTECKTALPATAPVGRKEVCLKVAACYGDGGSPLVVERDGDVAELVGITSWGYVPCGYNKRPTVYTEVSRYVDWIAQVQFAYYTLY